MGAAARGGQLAETLANALEAIGIVLRQVVRHAADRSVHARAAERFGIDHLAGGALHQVRAAEPHETGAFHHDDAIAERRQVRAARDARPHHGGDLRDAQLAPHQRIVEEDAAGAVLAGKDAVLVGQVDARGIHQVDDGQAVAHGDFLRAQNLGDGFRPPGAGLHGGVVGHDDGGAALDAGQSGDDAGGGRLAVVAVVGDQQADLEEARAGIDERGDALARGHLAGLMLALDARLAAALAEARFERLNLFDQVAHVRLCRDLHVISAWRNRSGP